MIRTVGLPLVSTPEKVLREFSAAQQILDVERVFPSIRGARLGSPNIVSRYQAQASWRHVVLGAIVSRGWNFPVHLVVISDFLLFSTWLDLMTMQTSDMHM